MMITAPLDAYLSPHAQQAVIAGFFLAAGWVVAAHQSARRDTMRRNERVCDIQRALLAEIRAHVVALEDQNLNPRDIEYAVKRIQQDGALDMVPDNSNDRIYSAIISEVHILPALVIDPVVTYYRHVVLLRSVEERLPDLLARDKARGAEMLWDYLELSEVARDVGYHAIRILTASLHGGDATILELLKSDQRQRADTIAKNLPNELAELRARFNTRS